MHSKLSPTDESKELPQEFASRYDDVAPVSGEFQLVNLPVLLAAVIQLSVRREGEKGATCEGAAGRILTTGQLVLRPPGASASGSRGNFSTQLPPEVDVAERAQICEIAASEAFFS